MGFNLLTGASRDPDERARFRARRKFQMDQEHNRVIAFGEGKLEGKLEEKLEIAHNLLSNEMPLDFIVKTTGLSLEEVQAMKN
jgi:predicted transposase/invertase (TIGR01784 family)